MAGAIVSVAPTSSVLDASIVAFSVVWWCGGVLVWWCAGVWLLVVLVAFRRYLKNLT